MAMTPGIRHALDTGGRSSSMSTRRYGSLLRRRLPAVAWLAGGLFLVGPAAAVAADAYELTESATDGRVYSIHTDVVVNGQFQTPVKDKDPRKWSVDSQATYDYRETRLEGTGRDAAAFRSARIYATAQTNIKVDQNVSSRRLHPQIDLLVVTGRQDGVEVFSPSMLLRRDDIDLLSTPGDSLALLALLPRNQVEVEEKWNAETWAAQMFADVDAVSKADIVCQLASVSGGLAKVTFTGVIEGATSGAPTKVSLTGHYLYSLSQKCISALEVQQTEVRSVGAISPGMNVVAKVSMSRQPGGSKQGFEPAQLAVIPLNPSTSQLRLVYDSPWRVRFLHDRNWHVFHQTDRLAILRLLEKGRLVSQCNVSSIAPAEPGSHTSESQFQSDIRTSLGDRLKKITKAEQLTPGNGDRRFIYRVVATGEANGRQLNWIYYLVAHSSGRQISLVFAVDAGDLAGLSERDVEMVLSLEFLPERAPTAAGP